MVDFYEEDPERYITICKALNGFDLDITPASDMKYVYQAEDFWRELWKECPETERDQQIEWLKAQIPKYFRSLDQPPRWIQNPNWQFAGGKPMIFAGQLDIKRTDDNLAGKFFHDDVSYYIFIPSYDLIGLDEYHPDRMILQRW